MSTPTTQRAIEQHLREAGDADTDELVDALGKPRYLIYQCITRWRKASPEVAPRIAAWKRRTGRPGEGGKPTQVWTMDRRRDATPLQPETTADYCRRYREKLGVVVRARNRAQRGGSPKIAPWLKQLAG